MASPLPTETPLFPFLPSLWGNIADHG